jgi:predicted dehydrogenase
MDVDELAIALIRFDNGMTLFLEEAWAIHMDKADGDTIFGSKGGIRIEPFGYFSDMFGIEANTTFDLNLAEYHIGQYDPKFVGYRSPQHHWVHGLLGRVPLIPTAEYAANTARISDAIYESSKKGREVKLAAK